VLGSEGFVGKPFCAYLEGQGETVVRFDIQRGNAEDGRHVALNLANIDRVYFLAWDVGGAKYLYREETQISQLEWNLRLVLNIMPQLHAAGIPFLFVSSQLAEQHDTVYGVTKRLGEVWTNLLNGVRVRLWNVYGPLEEPSERSHVVADFVHQALTTGEIRMLTTGTEQRQFVHISDVCRAFHEAIQNQLPGVYDVTSFEWTTVRHLADIIAELTGAVVTPGETEGSTPLTPIMGKIPGWLPRVALVDGLRGMTEQMGKQLR
jgi:nucleoside-diphosphate-sugar epimerase